MTTRLVSTKPEVSVIIPVRNCKEYIHEAVNSVLLQSFVDLEVLVVDDGSKDFDYKTLEGLDPRVIVTQLSGGGVSYARNVGIALARGAYLAFLDADDVWLPGKLEAQMRHFKRRPEVGVVFGQFRKWYADARGAFPTSESLGGDCSQLVEVEPGRSGWIYTRLLMGLLVGMNTAVVSRDVVIQIGGFNESMRIGEDYDFWLRASRVAQMDSLNGVVALYRIHPASAMHQIARENHMARLLLCANERWGTANPDQSRLDTKTFDARIAATHFAHGYSHFWFGELDIARSSFWQSLLQGFRRFHSLSYWLLTSLITALPWARSAFVAFRCDWQARS